MRSSFLAGALIAAIGATSGHAAANAPFPTSKVASPRADLLSQFMADPRPARARFTQTDERGRTAGTLVIASRGRLKWEQTAPYPMTVVSNGKTTWQVDPDLKQATRLAADTTEGWAAVFGNRQRLERDYVVVQKDRRVILTPRHADGIKATIDFDAAGHPSQVILGAGPGDRNQASTTRILFTQWSRLSSAPVALFDYQPGKDMDVVGAR